ncbi:DUF4148 domain-containing protein [Pseudoduganella sp.]|uniref:DUF4148 domain-containing protein n=1 Tax=Pseudoduganella sp. TaxID=1880898 RepID=UPI0035B0CB8E
MKAIATVIAALALSTTAYAAPNSGEGYQADSSFVSTKTRAEVKAETVAALRRGEILHGEEYPRSVTLPGSAKTRAEVKAELAAALRQGEIRHEQ